MYKRKLHPNFHQGAASLLSFFLLSFFSFALTLIVPSYPPPFSRHYLRPSFAFSLPRTSKVSCSPRCSLRRRIDPFRGGQQRLGSEIREVIIRECQERERERVVARGEYKNNTRYYERMVRSPAFFFLFYFEFW